MNHILMTYAVFVTALCVAFATGHLALTTPIDQYVASANEPAQEQGYSQQDRDWLATITRKN
jgi:hypothetical protein